MSVIHAGFNGHFVPLIVIGINGDTQHQHEEEVANQPVQQFTQKLL